MNHFDHLYALAAARKGGEHALEARLQTPQAAAVLAVIPDDRWLSAMAKAVFRAGFNWQVVEHKWASTEAAFQGFEPAALAAMPDEQLEALLKDPRIIRHWKKLKAIRANAQYLVERAAQHGSAGRYFAHYPRSDYSGLLADLKHNAAFVGGTAGQYFLREMGKDSFILSRDVLAALRRENVFSGTPGSKASQAAIQSAFNQWVAEGGQSLTRVSQVLAYTIGA